MVIVEGKIKGKQRPRHNKKGVIYTPSDTINYENWIRLNYKEQCGEYTEGPVRVEIIVYYKIPKSYSKKRIESIRNGLEYPTKKPDIDNITKIILDSLNDRAYKDDCQVVELKVLKRYTEGIERIEFKIEKI